MKINDGSSWKDAKSLKINNGSGWQTAKKAYVYNNGWQIAYPNLPVSLGTPTFTHTGTSNRGQVGAVLTVSSSWNSDPAYAPVSYTYQWKRGSSSISGATSQTYTAAVADIDQILGCTVTATNERGNTSVTGDIGTIVLPTVSSMTASDTTATPTQPSVSISYSGLSYNGSWTASSNATSYSVTTNNGSVTDNGNRTFSGSGSAGNVSVTVTPINTNKQVYMYWTAAPGAVSYDVVKYGNSVQTVINVPSTQLNYTWSIADGNEGNYFSVYPRSANYQGYGIQTSLTVSNKSGTSGSASTSIGCATGYITDWTYGGATWSGNCIGNTETGTYSYRYATYQNSNCSTNVNYEYGSYSTSRYCVPTCTAGWQAGSEYTYNSITWSDICSAQGVEGGTAANRTRTWVNADCSTETRTEYGPFYQSRACTPKICTYSAGDQNTSYHYSPDCWPSGTTRAGSLSGTTSGSCCPNVNKTITKWECKSYDVTNAASSNYSTCNWVGECDATYNSDSSRTQCWLPCSPCK
jgi:hypothetical protein